MPLDALLLLALCILYLDQFYIVLAYLCIPVFNPFSNQILFFIIMYNK